MLYSLVSRIRRWRWRRLYRPGRIVARFLAPDIRREVEIIDASQIEGGVVFARVRTWNVLYAVKGLAPEPPFGAIRKIEIKDLWTWTGEPWGGAVPESND